MIFHLTSWLWDLTPVEDVTVLHTVLPLIKNSNVSFCLTDLCLVSFREADITKEKIQKILATGANVVLTTGGIDDMCLKYFVDAGAMAVRRVLKKDLKRIAKASGGNCRNRHAKSNSMAYCVCGGIHH